ncbi:MAG: ABC transporter substrate-binding protein [Clostridiaceae bacterium]|nr:ABC transporter substrate-binding protein [Clostridiaceae bacterium]
MKKIISILTVAVLLFTVTACGKKDTTDKNNAKADNTVYFLNFKPEVADIYKEIAQKYEAETGVKVKVVTAASNTYETTLKSEIAKSDAPTIFQINGPVGYQSWSKYCKDLSDTKLYDYLSDKELAIKTAEGVFGIPYVVEGYGIIYNNAIMDKYFALKDKAVTISKAEEITNFKLLKEVVEDMTKHKQELGIDGVFASTSMSGGEQWRWTTHLLNMPVYYEMKDKSDDSAITSAYSAKNIDFKYSENFKNIFDLYVNNSTTEKGLLSGKSVENSMAEFALGKAAMVQNGNWAWDQISKVSGNTVKADDIKYLPLYIGIDGEEKQGLCIGTENYLAINKNVSEEKQKSSVAFLEWLFSSKTGKDYVVNKLNFISPFTTFDDNEKPDDPLAREVISWMEKDKTTVEWVFNSFPSLDFKDDVGNALLEYVQGSKSWEDVEKATKDSWKASRE